MEAVTEPKHHVCVKCLESVALLSHKQHNCLSMCFRFLLTAELRLSGPNGFLQDNGKNSSPVCEGGERKHYFFNMYEITLSKSCKPNRLYQCNDVGNSLLYILKHAVSCAKITKQNEQPFRIKNIHLFLDSLREIKGEFILNYFFLTFWL